MISVPYHGPLPTLTPDVEPSSIPRTYLHPHFRLDPFFPPWPGRDSHLRARSALSPKRCLPSPFRSHQRVCSKETGRQEGRWRLGLIPHYRTPPPLPSSPPLFAALPYLVPQPWPARHCRVCWDQSEPQPVGSAPKSPRQNKSCQPGQGRRQEPRELMEGEAGIWVTPRCYTLVLRNI